MSERKRKHEAVTGEKFDAERKVIPTKASRSSVVVAKSSRKEDDAMDTSSSAGTGVHKTSCAMLPSGII